LGGDAVMMHKNTGDYMRSILKSLLAIVFIYFLVSLLLTSIWGKQIILLRNGISQSQILYETPISSNPNQMFYIYRDEHKYGLIEAYPSGTIHMFRKSFYTYSVDVKTGVIRSSNRYESAGNTNCTYNASRENVGVKTRIGNQADGVLIYKYFALVHNPQFLLKNQQYEFKHELENNRTIYLFDSSELDDEQICLHVKFL
jgi:hypothetical protein